MIPSNKDVRKRLQINNTYYVVMNNENYFEVAEEFVRLQSLFIKDSLLEIIMQWFEMVISPLLTFFISWYTSEPPSIFSLMSIQKSIDLWISWYKFQELGKTIREWRTIVRSINGPFISTNNAKYHVFVYADAMQRIRNSLSERRSTIAKESTKSL